MFNSQHWQIKLVYAGFGGFLMFIGMLLSPVTAQRDKFGDIECTSLTVVDADGNLMGNFDSNVGGGYVRVWGKDRGEKGAGVAQLMADANGGRLDVFGQGDQDPTDFMIPPAFFVSEGRASVSVGSDGDGVVSVNDGDPVGNKAHLMVDRIGVWGKGDEENKEGSAQLSVNSSGGRLDVYGKADNTSRATVGIAQNGGGFVFVNEIESGRASRSARLSIDANGGRLDVYGKVANRTLATVQINERGNGAVSTWKKDGGKLHTLGESIRVSSSVSVPSVGTVGDVIESKIDGDFEGWDGETVVKLTNGQIWKQTQYHYEYHYAFMPDVLIYKSGSRYKMLVEGTDEAVYVERLE